MSCSILHALSPSLQHVFVSHFLPDLLPVEVVLCFIQIRVQLYDHRWITVEEKVGGSIIFFEYFIAKCAFREHVVGGPLVAVLSVDHFQHLTVVEEVRQLVHEFAYLVRVYVLCRVRVPSPTAV